MGTPERVATPYIVERDGTIFEVFDPRFWAYHLGIPAKTGVPAGSQDRRAVPIEIVNVGPLRPDKTIAGQLNWWPGDFGHKWCTTADSGSYIAAPYRGFNHYAAFPDPQMQAVAALVAWLGAKFSIPRQLAPSERRMAYDLEYFRGFRGVAAHHNFRPDKFDVGPAFDWAKLKV
jgi:N-acetyl-anhydromuramyl-L-alanine amidase AmpD